jgi:hypothetical protein
MQQYNAINQTPIWGKQWQTMSKIILKIAFSYFTHMKAEGKFSSSNLKPSTYSLYCANAPNTQFIKYAPQKR